MFYKRITSSACISPRLTPNTCVFGASRIPNTQITRRSITLSTSPIPRIGKGPENGQENTTNATKSMLSSGRRHITKPTSTSMVDQRQNGIPIGKGIALAITGSINGLHPSVGVQRNANTVASKIQFTPNVSSGLTRATNTSVKSPIGYGFVSDATLPTTRKTETAAITGSSSRRAFSIGRP